MPQAGVAFGVLSAISFGAGDFAGGIGARRAGALAVVAGAQLVGLVGLLVLLGLTRPAPPGPGAIALGLLAGLAGAVGLGALYRGMTVGSMQLVAALSGVGSLVPPLAVGVVLGATIAPAQLAGVVCAALAAAVAGGAPGTDARRAAVALALVASAGFGTWYVLLDLAARNGDPVWALVLSRASAAAVCVGLALVLRRKRPPVAIVTAAGILDAGGNTLFMLARGLVPVGVAAALSGLYPVVTVLLARAFLGERLSIAGRAGVGLAGLGIVLISFGA